MSIVNSIRDKIDLLLLLAITLFAGILLFNNLGDRTITLYDEAINSYHDIKLSESNDCILFPNKELSRRYYRKFPLKTFLKMPIYKAIGFSPFSFRFLDAFMSLITVIMVFFLGSYLFERWIGALAAIVLVTTKAIYVNWSRYNQYDAGFLFGTVLFMYLFIRYFDTKYGWFFIGLALGFSAYFKHIQSVSILSIVIIYLIITGHFKKIFSHRFLGMCSIAASMILAWAVPFQLKNPDFIKTFFSDEVNKRVIVGYFSHTKDYLFYFKSFILLGPWLFILLAIIPFFIFLLINMKDRKLLFLLIWVLVPLALLTFAQSKLDRYSYIYYPALALIIAYSTVSIIKKTANIHILGQRLSNLLAAFLVVLIAFQFHSSFTLKMETSFDAYRPITDFYTQSGQGTMYISQLDERDFLLPEYIHTYCAKRVKWTKSDIQSQIRIMKKDDALILSRRNFLDAIFKDKLNNLNLEDFRFLNYSPGYNFITTPTKVKVAIIKIGGDIERYLTRRKIGLLRIDKPVEPKLISDKHIMDFIQRTAEVTLGYHINNQLALYYQDLILKKEISGLQLFKTFLGHALSSDYHYNLFSRRKGIENGMDIDHPYRILEREGYLRNAVLVGLNRGNFSPMERGDLFYSLSLWEKASMPKKGDLEAIFKDKIRKKEGLIIFKLETLEELTTSAAFDSAAFTDIGFTYFLSDRSQFKPNKNFPVKAIVGKIDSPAFQLLRNHKYEIKPLSCNSF